MRQNHGLRYALLGVVSQRPRGIHGYALRRQCERTLGGFELSLRARTCQIAQ